MTVIITERVNNKKTEFESVLEKSKNSLFDEALKNPQNFSNQTSDDVENIVYEHMTDAARKTQFDGKIYLFSGHSFPDIVVNEIFGVEVKSTTQNHWTTTGNSVLESTRIKNIEFIYLFFAKLAAPIGFKYRLYQDCLVDVGVTHYPRYKIDMNINRDETIFSKMHVDYDEFRDPKSLLKVVKEYLRSIAKPGEEPWWIDTTDTTDDTSNPMVRLFSDLPRHEKDRLRTKILCRFPEVFGRSTEKFKRPATYLTANYGIVSHNIRDLFTAGGTWSTQLNNHEFANLPRIYFHVNNAKGQILREIRTMEPEDISYYWHVKEKVNPLHVWLNLVCDNVDSEMEKRFIMYLFSDCEDDV